MRSQEHGLLAKIARPVWFSFLSILITVLCVSLRINIVALSRLQSRIPIALNLQVRVGYHDCAVGVIEVDHRSWNQKVAELDLKQLRFLVQEEECSIN